jgi:hypothetical protein
VPEHAAWSLAPWHTCVHRGCCFRRGLFVRKSVTIPKAAWSSATRFRWTQDDFMASQETWMLDNIQLFQNFNPGVCMCVCVCVWASTLTGSDWSGCRWL